LVIEEDQSSPTNQLLSITYVVDLADRALRHHRHRIATVPVLYHSPQGGTGCCGPSTSRPGPDVLPEFTKGREREPMAA